MGEIIKGKCSCGFETNELKFGAGMADFEHSLHVPAITFDTAEIISVDIKNENEGLRYVPYSDVTLHDENCQCTKLSFFETSINQENNYCPACHAFKLNFESIALYD
jgi:hypothetical protein